MIYGINPFFISALSSKLPVTNCTPKTSPHIRATAIPIASSTLYNVLDPGFNAFSLIGEFSFFPTLMNSPASLTISPVFPPAACVTGAKITKKVDIKIYDVLMGWGGAIC